MLDALLDNAVWFLIGVVLAFVIVTAVIYYLSLPDRRDRRGERGR